MIKNILLFALVLLGLTSCSTLKTPNLQLAKSSYQVGAVDVLEEVAKVDSALFKTLYYKTLENSKVYDSQLESIFKKGN